MKELLCACGGKCNGICRKENLNRPRKTLKHCPAAYEKPIKREYKRYDNDEEKY